MALLDRLRTGIALTRDSLLLIRHHPSLALFPLVGGAAGLAFLGIFLGISFGVLLLTPDATILVVLFVLYLVLTFISTFFTAGLVHQTRAALEGETPSLGAGLRGAWEVKGSLFIWALISAIIGVIINGIENSDSRLSQMFATIFGVAWTLLTFFVIPVIVFEQQSTKGMFKRSAGIFRETWGETPVSLIGVQIVSVLVLLPFALPAIYLFTMGFVIPAVTLILMGALLSFLLGQTLQGVVKTTLYLYAANGEKPEEFDDIDFNNLAADRPSATRVTSTTTGGFR